MKEKLRFFEKMDHLLSWKLLNVYKSSDFHQKMVQVNVQAYIISWRMKQKSSLSNEWFSFYEEKSAIFLQKLHFFKIQPHCGTDYHYPINMKLCLNC